MNEKKTKKIIELILWWCGIILISLSGYWAGRGTIITLFNNTGASTLAMYLWMAPALYFWLSLLFIYARKAGQLMYEVNKLG